MKKELSQDLKTDFTEVLLRKFEYYCKREGIAPSFATLLSYLITTDLLPTKLIRYYLVLEHYPKFLYDHPSKSQAVSALSVEIGVSESTIYHIVANCQSLGKTN